MQVELCELVKKMRTERSTDLFPPVYEGIHEPVWAKSIASVDDNDYGGHPLIPYTLVRTKTGFEPEQYMR